MEISEFFFQVISLFLMMGLGFMMVKLHILKSEDSKVISMLSVYIIMPCATINAFQIDFNDSVMQGFLVAVILSILFHLLFFVICAMLKKYGKLTDVERLSVIYPNAGNLVIPLVTGVFGPEWVIYASPYMSVQNICQWTHGRAIMSGEKKIDLKKIFTNINLIAVFAGLLLFLFQIKLPGPLGTTVKSISAMIGPISMIMIGMMLAGMPLKTILTNKRIYWITALRLIIVPLLVIVLLKLAALVLDIQNEKTILTIVLIAMITPVSATTTQLAQFFDRDPGYCSAINAVTTLFCILTMPVMIAIFSL